jgi:hypothetical protein
MLDGRARVEHDADLLAVDRAVDAMCRPIDRNLPLDDFCSLHFFASCAKRSRGRNDRASAMRTSNRCSMGRSQAIKKGPAAQPALQFYDSAGVLRGVRRDLRRRRGSRRGLLFFRHERGFRRLRAALLRLLAGV